MASLFAHNYESRMRVAKSELNAGRKIMSKPDGWAATPPPGRAKVSSHQLLSHRLAKLPSGFERMMIMKAGIDAGPKDLVHQVTGVFEDVVMNAVGMLSVTRCT